MLEAALAYVRRGWPVFPLKPRDKVPLTEHGFKDASTNEDTIRSWWGQYPEANIGLATGVAGFFVVDTDPRNGGFESEGALASQGYYFSSTVKVVTGGGGTHRYYQLPCADCGGSLNEHPQAGLWRFEWAETARPEGWWYYRPAETLEGPSLLLRNHPFIAPIFWKKLAAGIDIKTVGGYVVAPPSVHPDGGVYTFITPFEDEPARPDGWLLDALRRVEPVPPTRVVGAVDPDDDRPGTEFNREHTWEEILEPHGWHKVGVDGQTTLWRRPGKSEGQSASTNYNGSDLLWVWSTSTEFDTDVSYTKFGAYALLEFGGDFSEAAASLAGEPSAPLVASKPPEVIRLVNQPPPSEFNMGFGDDHFITRYVTYAGKLTDASPEYHEAAALSLLAMMTPYVRAHLAPYPGGLKTNLYLMLVGSSTRSRKSTSQRIATEVLQSVFPNCVLPSKMTTEVFIEMMAQRPDQSTLWAPDELGVMLGQIYSVGFLGGIEDILLQLYGGEDYSYVTLNRNAYIRRPHLSILGAATPESIAFAGPQAMLGGLLPRFGVVFPGSPPPARPAGAMPDNVASEKAYLASALHSVLSWQAQGIEVSFTPGALAVLNAGESMLVDRGTHSARLPSMLYKVATLSAAARQSSVIEEEDAGGALVCVQRWQGGAERLQPYLRRKSAEIEFDAKCRQALGILTDLGGEAHRTEVARNLRLPNTVFNSIEATLLSWAAIEYDRTAGTWQLTHN